MHSPGNPRRGLDALRAAFDQRGEEAWAMFEELFRSSAVGLGFFDRNLRYVRLNETLARMNGLSVDEHLGRRVEDVLPSLARLLSTVLQRVLATGEPLLDMEIHTPFENGKFVLASFHPIRADGEILGVGVSITDITERKRMEEELRTAKARIEELLLREKRAREAAESAHRKLFELLEHAPTPIAVVRGPQFLFTFANAVCRDMAGGSDPSGVPFLAVLPSYAQAGGLEALVKVRTTGVGVVLSELPLAVREGDEATGRSFNVLLEPLREEDGTVESVLIVGAEVTEQVRARRIAEEAELRVRKLAEAIPHEVWVNDAHGRIEWQSGRLFPDGNASRVHPEDLPALETLFAKAMAGGEAVECEARLRDDSGACRWHLLRAVPFRASPEEPLRWFGTATDVDATRRSAEVLAESEARFRAVVENATIGIYFVNREGHVFEANDALLGILGYDRADLEAGLSWGRLAGNQSVFPPENVARELAERGAFAPYEREYVRKDGGRLPVMVSGAKLGPGGEIVVFVLDLRQTKEAERRQQAFRDLIVGMVGHDLRNPLAAILTSATLIYRRGELTERDSKVAKRIVSAAERMTRMISQLLDLTRVRLGGGIPIVRAPMNLHDLVRRVTEELQASWPDRRIELQLGGDGTGAWDADRLGQVVSNLLGNALEHGSPEAPVVVEAQDLPEGVQLHVKNRGAPIPAEALPVIFDPFISAPTKRSRPSSGLGLGLYIGRQIVQGHGGSIDVVSSSDGETTFTVVLPRA